jgi:CheY-like chemotaxis protein
LGQHIRELLDRRPDAHGEVAAPLEIAKPEPIPAAEMGTLRRRFLEEGQERLRQLLLDLDADFQAKVAGRAVHQWIGTGGLLGYMSISRMAREVELLLLEKPVDTAQLRESMINLALGFSSPPEAHERPLSDAILRALSGKVVAIVGLPAHESQRLCIALERVAARPVFFELSSEPGAADLKSCDLIVTYVRPNTAGSAWLDPGQAAAGLPTVFVGAHDHLVELDAPVQAMARQFLMDSWQPDEALVRLSLAMSAGPAVSAGTGASVARVLIAHGDDEIVGGIQMALEEAGIEYDQTADGESAMRMIRELRPSIAVLDVDLPDMHVDEVVAAIRSEDMPTRVVPLVAGGQQESDAFLELAKDTADYLVKPFSPLELVTRVRRLLLR